ncbi:hypothetical protein C8A05DRAFT_31923 [Staphylotrichum tortipilum]|uniref:Zn(2)-C6 fungal-type domain-containing protein n=1 Tax=Staphylotrichum tortipilum TaxID=2831512 RepID=A0AAN6RW46_9PEZI|nr:hypothetical protein C8A05DRAFT_31923 [Staphylotrichum longicolle]
MGFTTALEPRFRSAIPDTPPEVLTPDSASFPTRQSEERSWNPRAPPSPPMSNYDPTGKPSDMSSSSSSAGKGSEESSSRRESSGPEQSAPRQQQLPSLSSLFGPPPPSSSSSSSSSHIPPIHSPFLDRSSAPSYSASSSPLDHPLRPTTTSSYFPPSITSSASQPRSMFQDRPQIPALSRVFPGPLSPVPRPEPSRQDSRGEYGSSSPWSSIQQHESAREYSLGSREHSSSHHHHHSHSHPYYPPVLDRYSTHLGRGDDGGRRDYRDPRSGGVPPTTPSGSALNPPATPTSSVGGGSSEAPPAKDGLGPKIWTGTHFLPRFVRAAEVPGEGMCYFYDDGSHCKTVIDGEAVNAHWGVTKAGKPRKRLAIACVTCREKKIKCDPDYPRCVQCEKFGRVCKFKNAPRGGHNTSPSTPPAELDDLRRTTSNPTTTSSTPTLPRPAPDHHHARPASHSSGSASPGGGGLRRASPDYYPHCSSSSSAPPRKQARVNYEHYSPTSGRRSPVLLPSPHHHSHHQQHQDSRPGTAFAWRPQFPAPSQYGQQQQQPQHQTPELPLPLPRIHDDVLRRGWQEPRPDARV